MPTYTETLVANNLALQTMNSMLNQLNQTMSKMDGSQKKYNRRVKESVQAEEEVNKALETREQVLTTAMKSQRKFEIFSKKSFDAYRDAGGNAFDYLDLAITSTKQQVKLFGVEAALVRKVMYGFLPPGMFRAVNKLSTVFRFMGGALRKVGDNADEADNIFSKMTRGMIKGAVGLSKLLASNKEDFGNPIKNIKGAFTDPKGAFQRDKKMRGQIKSETGDLNKLMAKMNAAIMEGKNPNIISKYEKRIQKKQDLIAKMQKSRTKILEKSKMGRFFLRIEALPKLLFKFITTGLRVMGKVLIYGMLFLTIAYILWKTVGKTLVEAIQAAWPAIKESLKFVGSMFMLVIDGFKDIFNGFFGKDGSFEDVIDGLIKIATGLLGIAVGIIGVGLVILGGIIVEFTKIAYTKIIDWFAEIKNDWTAIFKSIPMILAIIAVIVSFILGAPVWLAVIVFAAVYKGAAVLIRWAKKKFSFMATGGTVSSDMQVVGEKGPELVSLPRGSKVRSNSNSKNMVGRSTVNNFNITVNARDSSKAEMRRMADEIGRMVSSSINRSTSSNTMR